MVGISSGNLLKEYWIPLFLDFSPGCKFHQRYKTILTFREVHLLMSVSEMLSGNKKILQSTTNADRELTLVSVSDLKPPVLISKNSEFAVPNVELPWLTVMTGRS